VAEGPAGVQSEEREDVVRADMIDDTFLH
jgi:hypothetical protein